MSQNIRRLMQRVVVKLLDDNYVRGRLGRKNADGSYSVRAADRAAQGYVYVTLTQDGTQAVTVAENAGVQEIPNLPVKMERQDGRLVIVGVDSKGGKLAAFRNGGSVGAVAKHVHATGSGLEQEFDSFWFRPGRVWFSSGVTVQVRPFFYRYNGDMKYFAGGTLALTSYLPATADKWAWIVVALNPSTNALTAVTGTEYDAQVDLLDSLIADVDMLDYIPLGAVQAQEGDTALSAISRYRDARHWLDERFRLDDLTNVTLTTPVDQGVLLFDDATDTWVDGPAKSDVGHTHTAPALDDLTDVTLTAPADGNILVYDDGASQWINAAPGATDVAAAIHAAAGKTTPVDADELGLVDSAASWALKVLTWANLKATLKTYLDTVYAALAHATRHQHGGADEVATATPAANAIPKAGAGGTLAAGWIPALGYQPLDTDLTEIAALANVADQMLYSNATANWALATLTAFARSLLDDAAASDARTTLGLGSIATAAAAAYLLLAGQAGGQTGNGGTGSGDSLTLHGSAHATKGPVLLNPTSGGAGIGTASPLSGSALHLVGANNPVLLMERSVAGLTGSILAALSVMATTSGDMANGFGPAIDGHINDSAVSGLNSIGRIAFRRSNDSDTTGDIVLMPAAAGTLTELLRLTYNGALTIRPGTTAALEARVGGVMFVSTTAVGNVGTGEDNLITYAVPANTLANDGDSLWFEAAGSLADNGNMKNVRARFGTTSVTLLLQFTGADGNRKWWMRGRLYRMGATSQQSHIVFIQGQTPLIENASATDQTLSGAVTLRITGEATSNDDVRCHSLIVGWEPANT